MKNSIVAIFFIVSFYGLQGQTLNYSQGTDRHQNIYRDTRNGIHYFPDSIRVEFPEQEALVVFELKNFQANNSFIENFPATLLELNTYLEKSLPTTLSANVSIVVNATYRKDNQKEVTIEEKKSQTKLLIKEKEILQLLPPGIEIYLNTDIAKVYIYVPERSKLQELSSKNFTQIVSNIRDASKNWYIGRKSFKARLIIQNNAISYSNILHTEPHDLIYATGSAAVGVLRDKLYPELTGAIGLSFSDRFNRRNRKIEFTYSSMFLLDKKPEGGYNNSISSFLGVSYRKNFNTKGDREMWGGIGASILVHETENFFQGKTAKLFILSDLGSTRLNIVPEFYLTNDFKKFQFGLKLNYAF